jgi:ribonuclease-3
MPRRSGPSRTRSITSTSTLPDESAPSSEPAASFAERLGLPVRDADLLRQALVHSSYLHEHPGAGGHNERLEFLGDAVVNLAISEALYTRHPGDDEGVLSARRATIVSTPGLARLAARLRLGHELLLGEGEAVRSARSRPSLLASSFEALIGALYIDLGYETVRDWLVRQAAPELDADWLPGTLKSPKSRLQEFTQQSGGSRPAYRVVEASGPDHDRTYTIEVELDGRVLGEGRGSSRRVAETAAAAMALEALREELSVGDSTGVESDEPLSIVTGSAPPGPVASNSSDRAAGRRTRRSRG